MHFKLHLLHCWFLCSSPSSVRSEEGAGLGDQPVRGVERPSGAEPVPDPGLRAPLQPQSTHTQVFLSREDSLTLTNLQSEDRCLSLILTLTCCLQDAEEAGEWQYVLSKSSSLVLNGLQRATRYRLQVRARSQAGYGSFSTESSFSTLPDGTSSHGYIFITVIEVQNNDSCVSRAGVSELVVTGVLVSVGILVLALAAVLGVFCYR